MYETLTKCSACGNNKNAITLNNSGTVTSLCLSTSQYVYNCSYYSNSTGSYVCTVCYTGYTLTTVSSTFKICVRNDLVDSNCQTYVLNSNNDYECSACLTNYALSLVYTVDGTIKKCLATATQVIRDCLVYEVITGGYQCDTCASTTNIAK
jgi:hypothetical protein